MTFPQSSVNTLGFAFPGLSGHVPSGHTRPRVEGPRHLPIPKAGDRSRCPWPHVLGNGRQDWGEGGRRGKTTGVDPRELRSPPARLCGPVLMPVLHDVVFSVPFSQNISCRVPSLSDSSPAGLGRVPGHSRKSPPSPSAPHPLTHTSER